jgi:hypothetical protein
MANGNGRRGVGGGLRRRLGMTKRPTTAGQARFGDVDVAGAQTTAREQARMNARLGQAARGVGGGMLGGQASREERAKLQAQQLGSAARRGTGY